MKLDELQTVAPVKDTTAGGSTKLYFRSSDDWDLSYEAGLVTVRKGEVHRIIPMANVAWMSPARPKEAKAKDAA